MPLDATEAALERDLVTLVNRTTTRLSFRFDGVVYTLEPHGKKGYKRVLPRYIAMGYAVPQNKIEEDFSTGLTVKSLLGIEDDERFPVDPLGTDVDLQALTDKPKHDFEPTTIKDPETGKVRVVTPTAKTSKPRAEDYSRNNE